MHFLRSLFGKANRTGLPVVRSRYSGLTGETFLVKLRTTTAPVSLRRDIRQGLSEDEDDLFASLVELRKAWVLISSNFGGDRTNRPDDTLKRLNFFEEVYEGLGVLVGKGDISYSQNFIQVLLFTLQDLTPELLYEHPHRVGKLLHLVQVLAAEDTSPTLLSEDFSMLFANFVSLVVARLLACSLDKPKDFQQLLFAVLQTNFVLGELYSAHLQYRPDIPRLLLRVLEGYREVMENSAILGHLLCMKAGVFVNSGLLRCNHLNLCLGYKEQDITLQLLVQLSHLCKFVIIDEANCAAFKHLVFEFLVTLVIGQFRSLPDDDSCRYIMIHKALNLAKLFMDCVKPADVSKYNLSLVVKELYCSTSIVYIKGRQSHGCSSFTKDNNVLARFFRFLKGTICVNLLGLKEMEGSIVLMLTSLTDPETLLLGRGLPPVIQAYSLELVNCYLNAVISQGLRIEWLVRSGICDVLFSYNWFVMEPTQDQRAAEVADIVANHLYEVLCRIVSVPSAAASCLHSWHFSISTNLSDLQYVTNSLGLLNYIKAKDEQGSGSKEGIAALSDNETFEFLLLMLDERLFSDELQEECVDKILQMLNLMLKLPHLEIKPTLLPSLYGKMLSSSVYFSMACDYLTEAFKKTALCQSLSKQFMLVLRDQTSSLVVKQMLRSAERVLQSCDNKGEREEIQNCLIKKIPGAVIKKINDTKDLGLCTGLLSLIRSLFSSSSRSSQLDVIENLFMSVKDIVKTRACSDSEFQDLMFNLLMVLFETTQLQASTINEVENPRLLPYIISILTACDNHDIVVSCLQDLQHYLSVSLFNLAVLSSFHAIDELLRFMQRPVVETQALHFVELIGSFYIRPGSLRLYLEKLNESINSGSLKNSRALVSRLLNMSQRSSKHNCKLTRPPFLYSRALPRQAFHFKSRDSFIKAVDIGGLFENDCCSFIMWLHPVSSGSVFSLYTPNSKPRLAVRLKKKGQVCVRLSPACDISWELPLSVELEFGKWSFLALTIFKSQLTVVVNNAPTSADLSSNIPSEFRGTKELTINFGCLESSDAKSFQGDLAMFYVVPGVREPPYLEMYSLGFDWLIEPRYLDARSTSLFEEPSSSRLKEMTDRAALKLTTDALSEAPKLISLRESGRPDSLSSASKVSVCTGHSLLEAFHALGGLKLFIGLLHKVRSKLKDISLVEQLVATLKNLLKEKHLLTYHEIVEQDLLLMLHCELRHLADCSLISEDVCSSVIELLRAPWLYRVPVNMSVVSSAPAGEFMLRHPGVVLLTDYLVWRGLDQALWLRSAAEAVAVMSSADATKTSILQVCLLNYFLVMARKDPLDLSKLKALPDFMLQLRSGQKLLSILQLIKYEAKHKQSLASLHFLLEIAASYATEDYQSLLDKVNMQRLLSLTCDFIVKECEEPGQRTAILKCNANILFKLLDVKVYSMNISQKIEQRSGAGNFKATLFEQAEFMSKSDMLGLVHKFFKRTDSKFDFKALLYLLTIHCPVLQATTTDELSILAEIIIDQFRLLPDFGAAYEAFYSFCTSYLRGRESSANFEYLSSLLEHFFPQSLNDLQLTFLMYFAEDICRNARLSLRLALLEQLYNLMNSASQAYNCDPRLPVGSSWEHLHELVPSCNVQFTRREGGFVRIFVNLVLQHLVSVPQDLSRTLSLLRKYLRLRPEQYRLPFTTLDSMASIQSSVDFQQFHGDLNLFGSEISLLGFVFGEIAEALRLVQELRVPFVFELMAECLLVKDIDKHSFMDYFLSRQQRSYGAYLMHSYRSLGAVCCSGTASGRDSIEDCYDTIADEEVQLIRLEGSLINCQRENSYMPLVEDMQTPNSSLRKLIDYALALTSAKVRLVEGGLAQISYKSDVRRRSGRTRSDKLPGKKEDAPLEQAVVTDIKHAANLRKLGRIKHKICVQALQHPQEVLETPIKPEFWKLAQISDAQGRRQRLVPFNQGSQYHDKVNQKYLNKPKEMFDGDIAAILQGMNCSSRATFCVVPQVSGSTDWSTLREGVVLTKSRAILQCERISVSNSVFGVLEINPHFIIFRSREEVQRPVGNEYEVSSLSYCHKQYNSLKIWRLCEIEEILPKVFMHVQCAVEVYCTDGTSYLFNLFQKNALISLCSMLATCTEYSAVYTDNGREGIMQWTKRWKLKEISNFEYLIKLNRYSSRSFNNLSQYPVFPWILTDYTKDRPIFTDDDFRRLDRPIGALHPEKLNDARSRYSICEREDGIGAHHYGSHYSVGGIVLYYLLRLEPYSAQAIVFQDNHFDIADRLFFSIQTAWEGSYSGSGDFKELVPELFFLPEITINLHNYNLGTRLTGESVDHVALPRWARADPVTSVMDAYRFMFFHRQALESAYVSANLHKWINLIFGSKQEDKEAVNVFFPLTYTSNFQQIASEADQMSNLLNQVTHFGQTPAKLFERNHEERRQEALDIKDRHFFSDFLSSAITEHRIVCKEDRKVKSRTQRAFMTPVVVSILLRRELSCVIYEQDSRYHAHFFDFNKPEAKLQEVYTSRDNCDLDLVKVNLHLESVNSEWFCFSDNRVLVSARHPDHSFRFSHVLAKPFRVVPKQQVSHHRDVVTCIELIDDVLLASGAFDGSLALWDLDLRSPELQCKLRVTLRGHRAAITQTSASAPLQLIASMSTVSST
jgi:hypothetical protein